jgi:hypothetical protein
MTASSTASGLLSRCTLRRRTSGRRLNARKGEKRRGRALRELDRRHAGANGRTCMSTPAGPRPDDASRASTDERCSTSSSCFRSQGELHSNPMRRRKARATVAGRTFPRTLGSVALLAATLIACGSSSPARAGASCGAAGGRCTVAECAKMAPPSAQDCSPNGGFGGFFCCLSPADAGSADAS